MIKQLQHLRSERGFTLVELLVVVTILGVLSAVAVMAVGSSAADSKVAACKTDVATVQAAADAYLAKTDKTATAWTDLTGGTSPYLRAKPSNTAYEVTLTDGTAASTCTAPTP